MNRQFKNSKNCQVLVKSPKCAYGSVRRRTIWLISSFSCFILEATGSPASVASLIIS